MRTAYKIHLGCILSHRYPFSDGQKCCSTNENCNKSDFEYDNTCCNGKAIDCLNDNCLNLGKQYIWHKLNICSNLFTESNEPSHYGLPASYSFKSVEFSSGQIWTFFYRDPQFFQSSNEQRSFKEAYQICQKEGASLPVPFSGKKLIW